MQQMFVQTSPDSLEPLAGSIFLVGMMGAGKSTVGRLLAQQLNFQFVDADREMEVRSGVPIPTIFEIEGESGFRRREIGLLDELTQQAGIVTKESPIQLSNIAHVDPKTGKATRIGLKTLGDGRRVRFAKKSGEVIDV